MSPPTPPAGTPRQITPEEAFSNIVILLQAADIAEVIHLSLTKSVNLKHVAQYLLVEQYEEKTTGEGKTAKTEMVPFNPPRLSPALFFGSNSEGDFLTPEEDAVFRPAWQAHGHLTAVLHSILAQMFPQEQPAPAIEEAAAADQGGQ